MSICDRLRSGITTSSAAQTRAVAQQVAEVLPLDQVLALHGELGAGKTTFVQGLATGLGVIDAVTSPTFNLFNIHPGTRASLLHFDAYRLDDNASLDALMLEDFLVSPWILAVEWPERIRDWLPATAWHLDLTIDPEQRHVLTLRPPVQGG